MGDTIGTVALGLLMLAAAPLWPWSRGWGWAPTGILAVGFATFLLFQFAVVPEA